MFSDDHEENDDDEAAQAVPIPAGLDMPLLDVDTGAEPLEPIAGPSGVSTTQDVCVVDDTRSGEAV